MLNNSEHTNNVKSDRKQPLPSALSGLRVIDLSRYAPGPYCTMILGDLGADIIKVEEAGKPSGRRYDKGGGAQGP